jgi:hypothetical protein
MRKKRYRNDFIKTSKKVRSKSGLFMGVFCGRFMDMGMETRFFSGQKADVMIGDENL